ncbi:MAG: winged helix-turn-helix domain-containing protein [Planctomycetaceae bacterium]|nr:winged helix-turn-helix domain-containing protein [Planctomycetaceae bacterium]
MSLLEAASQILQQSDEPLTTRLIIEQAAAQKLWTRPGGKTPHNTLCAAILREINNKGDASRFAKVGKGQFQATSK